VPAVASYRRDLLAACRLNERLPMPWVRYPLTPPDQRDVAEGEAGRLLQPAERDVLDEREDVALEGGEVDELAVLFVPCSTGGPGCPKSGTSAR
jgi:hypothetical protein